MTERALMCIAKGCVNRWTVNAGKGRFCSAHAWADLPKPTMYFGHSTSIPFYGAEEMRAAIEAEREACAKACEDVAGFDGDHPHDVFAAAIRARCTGGTSEGDEA